MVLTSSKGLRLGFRDQVGIRFRVRDRDLVAMIKVRVRCWGMH